MPWWKSIVPKRASDAQMNSELRFHIEDLTDENIAAGMPPDEARRRAILEFGGHEQIKEELSEVYRVRLLDASVATLKPAPASFGDHLRFPSRLSSRCRWPSAQTAPSSPPSTLFSSSPSRSPTPISLCASTNTIRKLKVHSIWSLRSVSKTGIASIPPSRRSPATTPKTSPNPPALYRKGSLALGSLPVSS